MITKEQINDVVNRIVVNCKPDKILLFGSYANGTANDNSDLDLIVVKKSDMPLNNRGIEVIKHLKGLLIPVDVLVYSQDEINQYKNEKYTLLYDVLKSAIVLYEKGCKD